ncbi:hypothetical protein [uncultured Tateyamaria sp.]|uniref:hypothetical protein n=1 Tax=uncultured Tateyamaria sp. TaxID=455651 RepID=UPI0026148202|nr:hypothetical protein [uncultured Tateyamaria sp.]
MMRAAAALLALAGLAWIAATLVQGNEGETHVNKQIERDAPVEAFVGIDQEGARDLLGVALREETFTMSPGVPEFRIELRNIFDADQTPDIREVTWARSSEENLTLWFAQNDGVWRAVHGMSWHPGAEF